MSHLSKRNRELPAGWDLLLIVVSDPKFLVSMFVFAWMRSPTPARFKGGQRLRSLDVF